MRIFASALLVVALGCAPPTSAPSRPTWSVAQGFIRDSDGRAVIMRGANVAGRHKEPPFFDFHGPAEWQHMRETWGMNTVRLLVSWAAIEPTQGTFDETYLANVRARAQAASDAGLLVFLDMHQDLYGLGFPGGNGAPAWTCDAANYAAYQPPSLWFLGYLTPQVTACVDGFWKSAALKAEYVEAWRRLAIAVKGVPGVIGIDPMNEPFWGSATLDLFEPKRVAPLYLDVIAAVRAEWPEALLFAEPASSRNLGFPSRLPPLGVPNVVYAPHAYDADAESGKGFAPSHRQAVLDNIDALAKEAESLGAALMLGEYGGVGSAPGIVDYMDAVYAGAGAHAAGATVWEYGKNDGYGLLAADGTEKTEYLSGVVRPFPERTAGTPRDFAFDATTRSFTFHYDADPEVTAPTLISLPTSTWSGAVAVECGGCVFTRLEHQLRIDSPAPGVAQTLVLSP